MKKLFSGLCFLILLQVGLFPSGAENTAAQSSARLVQARLDKAVQSGKPLIVHVIVALCDNEHQGIVPVPAKLGNGRDPGNNLYWGAMYGVRSFLTQSAGWKLVSNPASSQNAVLDKIVLHATVSRSRRNVDVYLVAEAWDGSEIKGAIKRFFRLSSGKEPEHIQIGKGEGAKIIHAGGSAHLIAYIGHNGLMDFSLGRVESGSSTNQPKSALVLACKSKPYFLEKLKRTGAHGLLLTNGLMAPEAYTFDAAIRSWCANEQADKIVERAAAAYHKYQKCGMNAAKRLFFSEP